MKLPGSPPAHLTYCLNVHPGETLADCRRAIVEKACRVRDLVLDGCPGRGVSDRSFGLGLRLGAAAAREAADPHALAQLKALLDEHGLYAFTINGFPYGQFHNTAVKQDVYAPDWRTTERRDYTIQLASVLAALLPQGVSGSISTVPGSYKPWITTDDDVRDMVHRLCDVALHMDALGRQQGKLITLGLEPEPDCYIETTAQAVDFITGPLLRVGLPYLRAAGMGESAGEELLRRHIGICLDTAHMAVEFEDPAEAAASLRAAGVTISKVQLSAALEVRYDSAAVERLAPFCDPVYLHQTKVRLPSGEILHHPDLAPALTDKRARVPGAVWRVHFHVPLFFDSHEGLASTSRLLEGPFARMLREGLCEHLEIETYTLGVLPHFMRPTDVTQAIAREYGWVLEKLVAR